MCVRTRARAPYVRASVHACGVRGKSCVRCVYVSLLFVCVCVCVAPDEAESGLAGDHVVSAEGAGGDGTVCEPVVLRLDAEVALRQESDSHTHAHTHIHTYTTHEH